MKSFVKRTWCEVNLDNLHYNMNLLKNKSQKSIMAVIKANAYGHGDKYISTELESTGIKSFAVSNAYEGVSLRKNKIKSDILILGYTPVEIIDEIIEYDMTQTIFSAEYATKLIHELEKSGKKLKVHIKIDTGMNRIGFPDTNTKHGINDVAKLLKHDCFIVNGIFTHFSHADSFTKSAKEFTKNQMDIFDKAVFALEDRGFSFETIHAQNSAGIMNFDNYLYNSVRAGLLMFGLTPSSDIEYADKFKPIMEFKSIVTQVKPLSVGDYVSYSRDFCADREMKVATVSVGYADGYRRSFAKKAEVIIRGERCRIIGRICMDQMIVDVSHIKNVAMGDEVILVGRYGKDIITFDELAKMDKTINYEIVCGISRRVPRLYIKNHAIIGIDVT